LAERKPHLKQNRIGKSRVVPDLEIAESRKWTSFGRSIAQATAYSTISTYYECVVALNHLEKIWFFL